MEKLFHFKQAQKFRVRSEPVSFICTARHIRNGVGDSEAFNAATQKALCALEGLQSSPRAALGLTGVWEGIHVQLDKAD